MIRFSQGGSRWLAASRRLAATGVKLMALMVEKAMAALIATAIGP